VLLSKIRTHLEYLYAKRRLLKAQQAATSGKVSKRVLKLAKRIEEYEKANLLRHQPSP
jgi:hypothetical protein